MIRAMMGEEVMDLLGEVEVMSRILAATNRTSI
jgi:hypothetical protein